MMVDTSFDASNKQQQIQHGSVPSKQAHSSQCSPNTSTAQNTNKKHSKKKTSQTANELDEERTNKLVSDLLRNIKEKTKELESMNQNIKSTGKFIKCHN